MRLIIGGLTAAVVLITASAASATPCTAIEGESAVVSLEERDQDFVAGLTIGVVMPSLPRLFPANKSLQTTKPARAASSRRIHKPTALSALTPIARPDGR
jgi:hypothetical protein